MGQMRGQTGGPGAALKRVCERRRLRREDVVAALQLLADELGESHPGVDANHVSKWFNGTRNIGPYYRPRLCVALDSSPEELDMEPTPRLKRDVNDLRMRSMNRRQFLAKTALVVGSLTLGLPGVDAGRMATMAMRGGQDSQVYEDLLRITVGFADQLDMVAPTSLMPQVFGLLEQEKALLHDRSAPSLLEVTTRTAIVAGWLAYNVNNRGDAGAFWDYAEERARELGSDQMLAYALGVKSTIWSAVPKRGSSALDAAISTSLLDQAISLAKKGSAPSLRGWLYSRRAEEHAVAGNRRGAYADIDRAYKVLGRNQLSSDDFPILRTWKDARLSRYHGSVAELVHDHREAIAILTSTLAQLPPSYLPQRAMAMTDLATAYARLPRPEVEHSSDLLGQAHDIAAPAGLGEAMRRIMEVRHHLQPWVHTPAVKQLDERLRLVLG